MLVKYMPRNLVSNVNRNLERRGGNYHGFGNMMPNVDISEDRDRIYIQMEVPGYSKDNVNVNLNEGNILAISGESKHREEFEDRKFSKIERRHGKFKRSFALPDRVDSEKISASVENGVLEVTIEKLESAKPKDIDIK